MQSIYPINNFPFWSESEIQQRLYFSQRFHSEFQRAVQARNRAWLFEQIEAPMMIPMNMLSAEYQADDLFAVAPKMSTARLEFMQAYAAQIFSLDDIFPDAPPVPNDVIQKLQRQAYTEEDWPRWLNAWVLAWLPRSMTPRLALRPETTPATYAWMAHRLEASLLFPYCCWQLNKSFRREQDQPTKHMRLKEFYQQEYQMAYLSDSFEDWHAFVVEPVKNIISQLTMCPTRVVVSDRLPHYSVSTIDIEVWNSEKWMEICSISKRVDFPDVVIPLKKVPRTPIVCEVATSPDRQYYCFERSRAAWETLPIQEHRDHDWLQASVSNEQTAAIRLEKLAK